jgi:hypothetical protein
MPLNDRDIIVELIRRQSKLKDLDSQDPTQLLFDKQLEVLRDKNPFKAALCTRRAGKSYLAGAILYQAALKHPGSTALYVGLTRASVQNIMWPVIRKIKEKLKITCDLLDSSLEVKLPNGSRIWCVGADMKNFIPRLLGGAYPVGIIDEAQDFRSHIESLVDDVLTPAIGDYRGSIYLFGTPGPIPNGYFYDTTEHGKNGFTVFKWSIFDNPHFPDPKGFVNDVMKRKGWTWENPTVKRQYLGLWDYDEDSLFYKFKDERNTYSGALPGEVDWDRILGVDYGFNDRTSFSVVSYNNRMPNTWVEYNEAESGLIPTEIAGRLTQLIEKFQPSRIVADTGGLGKSITEEMKRRYGIPIVPASKTDKKTWVHLMNGDMIDGNFKVHESLKDLRDQYMTLTKTDNGDEEPSLPNDRCDSTLYAWREARAYAFEKLEEPPTTLKQKWEREERELLEKEEK